VQLKPKNEFVLFCDLTSQQKQLYEAFLTYRDERGPSSGHHRALWDRHRLHNLIAHPHLFWKKLHSYRDECKRTLAEIEEAHEQGEESSLELQASRDHFAALTKLLATIQPNGAAHDTRHAPPPHTHTRAKHRTHGTRGFSLMVVALMVPCMQRSRECRRVESCRC
jgi:uncharacterized coiled-coil protein SlyX